MADDFLGISAHIDINSVITGFNSLIKILEETESVSNEVANNMTSALARIQSEMSGGGAARGVQQLMDMLDDLKGKVNEAMNAFSSGSGNINVSQLTQMLETYQQAAIAASKTAQEAYQAELENLGNLEKAYQDLVKQQETMSNVDADYAFAFGDKINEAAQKVNDSKAKLEDFSAVIDGVNMQVNGIAATLNAINQPDSGDINVPSIGEGVNETLDKIKTLQGALEEGKSTWEEYRSQLDLGDFEGFVKRIIDGLDKLGERSDGISKKLEEALNAPDVTKILESIEQLREGMKDLTEGSDEYNAALQQIQGLQASGFSSVLNVFSSLAAEEEDNIRRASDYIELLRSEQDELDKNSTEYEVKTRQISEQQDELSKYNDVLSLIKSGSDDASASLDKITESQARITEAEKAQADASARAKEAADARNESLSNLAARVQEQINALAALDAAYKSGAITYDEYLAKIEQINSALQRLRDEQVAALNSLPFAVGGQIFQYDASGLPKRDESGKEMVDETATADYQAKAQQIQEANDKLEEATELYREVKQSEEEYLNNESIEEKKAQIEEIRQKLIELEGEKAGIKLDSGLLFPDAIIDLLAKVTGNDTLARLSSLNEQIKVLKSELSDAKEGLKAAQEEASNADKKPLFVGWYDNLSKFKNGIKEGVGNLVEPVSEFAEKVKRSVGETFDSLKTKISEVARDVDSKLGVGEVADRLGAKFDAVKEKVSGFGEGMKNWVTGNGKAQEAIEKLKSGLNNLPGPLGGAVTGMKQMVLAAKAFIMTPLGAILGVIVFLLKAFQTWATKSAEGQRVMAKVTAYLGSILDSLTDVLIKVGGYLFHAFADATGPMNEFARNLVTTLKSAVMTAVNLLKGLGDVLGGIWTMFTDDWEKGWEQIKKGASEVVQSGKNALNAVQSGFKTTLSFFDGAGKMIRDGWNNFSIDGLVAGGANVFAKADAAAQAAGILNEEEEKLTDYKKQQLAYDNEIADASAKVEHATKETLDATVKTLRALNEKKYDALVAQQQKRVDLLKQENELHQPTLKSIAAQKVAELELFAIQKKRDAAKRAIDKLEERQEKRIEAQQKREENATKREERAAERKAKAAERKARQDKKAADREAKRSDKQKHDEDKAASQLDTVLEKNTQARVKEEADMALRIEKARIDAMKDGAEKRRALREYEHKKELADLDKSQQELIDKEIARQKEEFEKVQAIRKAQGKTYRAWNQKKDLDLEPIKHIERQYEDLAELQQQIWDAEATKELTDKYKDYYDKRIEAEEQFNEDISRLIALRNAAAEKGNVDEIDKITRAIAKAEYEKGKARVQNAINEIRNNPDNDEAYEDLSKASASTIEALIKQYRKLIKPAEDAGASTKAIRDEVEKLQNQLMKNAPFVAMKEATEDARGALDAVARARRQLEDIKNGQPVIKEIRRNITTGENEIILKTEEEAKKELANAEKRYEAATLVAIAATKQAIGEIDKLRAAFENLGKAIGGDLGQIFSYIGSMAGYASSGITSIIDNARKTDAAQLSGDKMGAAIGKANIWIAAMTTMMSIIGSVTKLLPTADDWYEKYAKKQRDINNLRRAVDEYKLSVLAVQQAERNWFSASGLTSLTDAYEKHGKVIEAYYAKLYEAQEKYHNKSSGLSKAVPYLAAAVGVAASIVTAGAAGAAILGGTLLASLGTAASAAAIATGAAVLGSLSGTVAAAVQSAVEGIRYKSGQVAAKDNLKIQTRHKTWFRGEKTQDLSEWTREQLGAELFDDEGLLNLEAAQTILERYGDKLVGETKATLEDLIKLREQYNEFMKQVEEYVSNLYSPLVDDMTDALFQWLETGTDVLYQFRQNAKDTFAAISKDMVKQMLMTEVFDQYKEDLKKIYAAYAATKDRDTLINGIMLSTDSFLARAESEIPAIQEALTKINDKFAERGFDLSKSSDEGSGAYKAAQTFTQEQGDELNGRLTAIQIGQQQGNAQRSQLIRLQEITFGVVVQINASALATSKDISAMRDMQYSSLQRLMEISAFTSVLPSMANDISDMRNDIRNKL